MPRYLINCPEYPEGVPNRGIFSVNITVGDRAFSAVLVDCQGRSIGKMASGRTPGAHGLDQMEKNLRCAAETNNATQDVRCHECGVVAKVVMERYRKDEYPHNGHPKEWVFISEDGQRSAHIDRFGINGPWRVFYYDMDKAGYAGGGGAWNCRLLSSDELLGHVEAVREAQLYLEDGKCHHS